MNETVSIMMNCYNGATYLEQAIESIRAQTFEYWELIFWDNRSTDSSAEIANSFADPRIKYYLADEHTSLGEARRRALEHCRGPWLAFLDCDDLWKPAKLKKQTELAAATEMDLGFVYSRTELIAEDANAIPADHPFRKYPNGLPAGNVYARLLRGNYISLPSLLVNREALDAIGGFSGRFPIMEDYYMTLNIAKRYPVAVVDEVLCSYRLHGKNASLLLTGDTFEDLSIVRQHLPEVPACIAGARIVCRHLKKSVAARKFPDVKSIVRALT